jgi:Protein of unknown function (DUF2849)
MSSAAKRPPLPVILLANDLLDGDVVFRTQDGWSRDPALAFVARDDAAAAALEADAAEALAAQQVVAYLVDVAINGEGRPVPAHFRERFKTRGPSHRPDLGKQAEFGRARGVRP